MDTFFLVLRKTVIAMVFVMFASVMLYVPQPFNQPNQAEAGAMGGGSTEITQILNNIQLLFVNIADTAVSFFSNALNLKEFTLDGIAWAIAKQIVSNMVSSLVDWINSGFQGSPAFVQNLGDFLLQAADEAFGAYLEELGSFVCSPFRLDVQLAVAINYDASRVDNPPTCTLTGIFENYENFVAGEWEDGGWKDWFTLTAQPQTYTRQGSIFEAQAVARARVINAKGEEINILGFGDGFLSGKICEQVDSPSGPVEQCAIAKPGKTISESLNKALGAGQDSLVTADEIDEIIAALLGQLANAAITGASGLLGLSGGTGYSYTGYSRGSFASELVYGNGGPTTGGVDTGTSGGTAGNTNPGDTSFAAAYVVNSLQGQIAALTRIDEYIVLLNAFIARSGGTPAIADAGRNALAQAQALRAEVSSDITAATPLVQAYSALETEYETATVERRIQIRNEQSDILQDFNALGLTSDSQLESVFSTWDALMGRTPTPTPTTPFPDFSTTTVITIDPGTVQP